jgi:hypothetical protein
MTGKLARRVVLLTGVLGVVPAMAEPMGADEARRFVAGRMFAYNCFDGTTGSGRIHADGSIVGYIQIRGSAPRFVAMPSGTLRVKGDQYCAAIRGMPFEPCFNLNRTSHVSFRGSVSGFSFAYCDFNRRSARVDIVQPRAPLRLRPLRAAEAGAE